MSNTTSNSWGKVFFALASSMTAMQIVITAMPTPAGGNNTTQMYLSAIIMFLASIFTLLQQKFSTKIDNSAQALTWLVIIVGIAGAVNQAVDIWPMKETTAQWIRFGVTLVTQFISTFSKIMYPSEEQKQINFQKRLQNDRE